MGHVAGLALPPVQVESGLIEEDPVTVVTFHSLHTMPRQFVHFQVAVIFETFATHLAGDLVPARVAHPIDFSLAAGFSGTLVLSQGALTKENVLTDWTVEISVFFVLLYLVPLQLI